jgi:hypothetical protein
MMLQFPERKSSSIFGTLNNQETARMADRYNVSKMLEVLACREITRLHSADHMKVTMNFVNPGWCHSELMREVTNPVVNLIKKLLCRSTEVGSRPIAYAGLAGPETHGKYISDSMIKSCAPLVEGKQGPEMQRRVWAELSAKLEEIEPGVLKVLG